MPDDLRLNTKGTIILGATASDPHVVPIFLAKMILEADGYTVRNLRACNTVQDFARAAGSARDTVALIIANNNGAAAEDLAGLDAALACQGVHVPVILGGHYWVGLTPAAGVEDDLHARGVTHFCTDMAQMLPLLAQLREVPECSRLA